MYIYTMDMMIRLFHFTANIRDMSIPTRLQILDVFPILIISQPICNGNSEIFIALGNIWSNWMMGKIIEETPIILLFLSMEKQRFPVDSPYHKLADYCEEIL